MFDRAYCGLRATHHIAQLAGLKIVAHEFEHLSRVSELTSLPGKLQEEP